MLRFMAVVLTYRGRAVTKDEVAFIRALDSLNPEVAAVQPIPPAGLPK